MKKLYLIDASNMFFRAYYAIRPLTNSKGLPTNALYGYTSMTVKLLREVKPDYMAYCYDSKEDGFREELYPEYKANRSDPPEDLIPQFPYFQKISDVLGIPSFQISGVEADDIIGTLAEFGRKNNLEVVIVSGDKDFAQLICPQVKMYDTMKEITYDVDKVKEKWGVRPDQIIDYLALMGDASDNIPGVEGVGQKTAQKLLNDYDSIDGIYEKINQVKPDKLKEKLIRCKDDAYLSKKLVTIQKHMDMDLQLDKLKLKPIDRVETVQLLEELEFKTFERKIFGSVTPKQENSDIQKDLSTLNVSVGIKDSSEDSQEKKLSDADVIESESKKSENRKATLFDSHLKIENKKSVEYEKTLNAEELSEILKDGMELWILTDERRFILSDGLGAFVMQDDLDKVKNVLDSKKIKWKGFDLKKFWRSLQLKNVDVSYDHQIAAYVVNAGNIGSFEEVYEKSLNLKLPDFPEPIELLKAHLRLEQYFIDKLQKINGIEVYQKFDLPLVPVLHSIETQGVLIDIGILKEQSAGLYKDIHELEKNIHEMAGEVFNIASPKQLAPILFEKLKLTPIRKTKTGFSTDSDVLEKLENEHPIARLLIEYRELSKLKSTYVDALPTLVSPKDHRIHTVFHQTVTSTGRLSSTNPNLQNIPIRTERGNAIRKAFIAENGFEIISADYSQIELRILAHVTQDPGLVKAFEQDLDIHAATASEIFGISLKEVTPELRRIAKAVNFGLAYGMGAHGLAENLKISRTESSEIIKKYFMKFAKVKDYMTDTVEIAKKQGFVETEFGRRRYFPELQSKNAAIRAFGERAAINAPMQGTASDIVKKAMIDIYNSDLLKSKTKMILQVHDELLFEVPTEELQVAKLQIKDLMENVVKLRVPLKVNAASGKSWFEAH